MNKTCLYFLVSVVLLFLSCKKNQNAPAQQYKIKLLSGSNQSDTIGRVLKTGLTFSVLKDNLAIREGYVRFITVDCDNETNYVDYRIVNDSNTPPIAPVYYSWQLNQSIGIQTLKVILMDSVKNPRDSLTVTATGLAPSTGWHISGCIPKNTFCVSFAQLSSGRVYTALSKEDFPYFSDDNGSTWHAVSSFPIKREIADIITTKENELFITIPNTGIYYSQDNGQSWQQRNAGLPMTNYSGYLQYTASGILFTPVGYSLYYSSDKGLSWIQAVTPSGGSPLISFGSMTDGTIITTMDGELVKSRDGGATWQYITSATRYATTLLVSSQNYIYMGTPIGTNNASGIFLSKDTGQTWTQVYDSSPLPGYDKSVYQLTEKDGSYYFYASGNNLLTRTSDFVNYTIISPPGPLLGNNGGRVSYRYIAANSSHFILSTELGGLYYQTP